MVRTTTLALRAHDVLEEGEDYTLDRVECERTSSATGARQMTNDERWTVHTHSRFQQPRGRERCASPRRMRARMAVSEGQQFQGPNTETSC